MKPGPTPGSSQAEPAPKGQREWPVGWIELWPCSQLLQKAKTEQVQELPFSEGLPTELHQQSDAQCHVNLI